MTLEVAKSHKAILSDSDVVIVAQSLAHGLLKLELVLPHFLGVEVPVAGDAEALIQDVWVSPFIMLRNPGAGRVGRHLQLVHRSEVIVSKLPGLNQGVDFIFWDRNRNSRRSFRNLKECLWGRFFFFICSRGRDLLNGRLAEVPDCHLMVEL